MQLKCAKVSEIQPGSGKSVTVKGEEIALFNVNGTIYACANTCVHQGGPLGEGFLEGKTVTCPWHGWKYDVSTGACVQVQHATVKTYAAKVEGDDIFLEM